MREWQTILQTQGIPPLFKEMRIGLEKESQRVTPSGELANTDHPKRVASRDTHPYIQTDFSETQVELITPVFDTNQEVLQFLGALHEVALRSMDAEERLWPLSMPPVLPEDDREIMIAKLSDQGDVNYRRYLAKVYGKRKQMVSGIHYNFEFSKEMIESLFKTQEEHETIESFKTDMYLKTSRHYMRYRWLITYLFGASPYAEAGYFTEDSTPEMPVRSIRNSHFGYTNRPEIEVSYDSLERYITDITDLVDHGDLIEAKEFYASVRLRGGKNFEELCHNGIGYIELRNIDLDPFAPYGITSQTLEFLHLFVMLMLWIDETETAKELLDRGTESNEVVSLEHPLSQTSFVEEGRWLLEEMSHMLDSIQGNKEQRDLVIWAKEALEHPEMTLSGRMLTIFDDTPTSNHDFAVAMGQNFYEKAQEKPYQLEGYRHMELSTQILMFDALQQGIKVEVLDESDQFLKLKGFGHTEYVKNANMTSKDSYVVPLLMENKTVTKKVLAQAGFVVPLGKEFGSVEDAMASYERFEGKGIVVKPKSTNYGLGISIFKEGATAENYQVAVEIAFREDDHILVEEFLPGTEYRFFVLDGKTRAIMQRTPANVEGTGHHSIKELVAEKNKDSLRGTHHRSPLELIQLGDIEQLMLKEQGYTIDSVPNKGDIVYLRENSNVSTGGDSIDVTDEMDDSYKKIAEEAVKAMGATICGIDLIIPDRQVPGDMTDGQTYGIIEGNFNPAMHMHIYPYAGASRRLTMDVLRLLYPEIK